MVASVLDPRQAQFLDVSKYTLLSKKEILLKKIEEFQLSPSNNTAVNNSVPPISDAKTNMVIFSPFQKKIIFLT